MPGELTPVHGGGSVYILDTDYDTYASHYQCSVDGEKRFQQAAIISRTNQLDPAIVESQMEIFE
ncbi:hypothetical protein GUF45_25010, partial [Xanthomonas citri pv. citri]|nr:hypothetical protein [Xanthomonas citri pv. citri]